MLVFQDHKITHPLATHDRYHTASNVVLITSLPLPALAASIRTWTDFESFSDGLGREFQCSIAHVQSFKRFENDVA